LNDVNGRSVDRLGIAALPRLGLAGVARFGYDRDAQATGILHIGIGAFHRAHQAWYTDRAMDSGERHWAITGVSLRSSDVARQMGPQQGLYTVTERCAAGTSCRIVGAVREVLVASHEPGALVDRLAATTTHIASLTITEKGYCRAADGSLDSMLADNDSIYRYLAAALRRRHDAGLPGLTLLSCDNLAANGAQLLRLVGEYLDRHDPALAGWFLQECACPSTMVDRIVPATTDADRALVADSLVGLRDEAAVVTEPFSQWVVEDRFAGPRPLWEKVGAEMVSDVVPYETAKLRMLNGAHSALAYIGLARGHRFVHEAMTDRYIRALIISLLRDEAAPTIAAAPGQNLERYADALIDRFENPALNHRLGQIAQDGSQKIPQRWLDTIAANQRQGRSSPAILAGIAAWIAHLRGANGPVEDPRAAELARAVAGPDAVNSLFGNKGLIPSNWRPDAAATRAAV
jgi:fructuronate reductase